MVGVGFFYIGAILALWLAIAAVVKYKWPDSTLGRVLTVIT